MTPSKQPPAPPAVATSLRPHVTCEQVVYPATTSESPASASETPTITASPASPNRAEGARQPNNTAPSPATATSTSTSTTPRVRTAEALERKRQSRKRARAARARRERPNTSVYVTGLPADASTSELATHFAKCGIVQPDGLSGAPRIHKYRHADGRPKGDALVTYARRASVDNAVAVLDGAPFRGADLPLAVSEARFSPKRVRHDRPDVPKDVRLRARELVDDALGWGEGAPSAAPAIVVLKNVFDPAAVDYDTVRQDMREGLLECGALANVTVFERSLEGVVLARFHDLQACLKCIQRMHGRWYDGRKLAAQFYDGVSDFRVSESDQQAELRDQEWQSWLEGPDEADSEACLQAQAPEEGGRPQSDEPDLPGDATD